MDQPGSKGDARGAHDGVNEAVTAVTGLLVADVPLETTLDRVAVLARDALPTAASTGVVLLDGNHRPSARAVTDSIAPEVHEEQFLDGDGPGRHAFETGELVLIESLDAVAKQWPGFARTARAHHVRSALAVPLAVDGHRLGTLDAYATEGSFTRSDAHAATVFAKQAAVVIANAQAYWTSQETVTSLQAALQSRSLIDMAKGKIMAQNDCDPDEAFAFLVKASQRENVKLREIARRIVEGKAPLTSG